MRYGGNKYVKRVAALDRHRVGAYKRLRGRRVYVQNRFTRPSGQKVQEVQEDVLEVSEGLSSAPDLPDYGEVTDDLSTVDPSEGLD